MVNTPSKTIVLSWLSGDSNIQVLSKSHHLKTHYKESLPSPCWRSVKGRDLKLRDLSIAKDTTHKRCDQPNSELG
jgi:hypothetical protein